MVYVQLTNGFGNNLFQIAYAKIISHELSTDLRLIPFCRGYYAIPALRNVFNFPLKEAGDIPSDAVKIGDDSSRPNNPSKNYLIKGHFEDFNLFLNHRDLIKSWFTSIKTVDPENLTIHLRLGDRLFLENQYGTNMFASVEQYENALKDFKFKKVSIVTDVPFWREINANDLLNLECHTNVCRKSQTMEKGVIYFNEIFNFFNTFNPHVRLNQKIDEDFNFIRSSSQILFMHSTFSWWAAFLSNALKVSVYGPWRPIKQSSNKNLSKLPLENWSQWI